MSEPNAVSRVHTNIEKKIHGLSRTLHDHQYNFPKLAYNRFSMTERVTVHILSSPKVDN
jgi:hypothetical protein